MMPRVLKRFGVVMCLAVAAACGGEIAEEGEPVEVPATPAADASGGDVSAMGPIGGSCGTFQRACCEGYICYNGLECDPNRKICLY
jgi:hypothetical protein